VLKLKSDLSELEQLKELLLADELAQLKELGSKLESLNFEAQDEETIIERVTPLFDKVLLERLESKDARTQEILSKYLADIITRSSEHDGNALSYSLQSVISPAISKEIANNKDSMIDALYPIMGGMISKYVTQAIKEMMETINKKIESGLSFDRYKRKVKSKITGVSETELLLEESAGATLSSMFVIHKETSLLVAEANLENKEIDDPHMVASMASAIKDFINDWIETNQSKDEIQILSYGNATLYIESAGSVYIIAFFDSEPDYETRSDVNDFFASIMKEYAEFFHAFDGDDSAEEIVTLSMKMEDYIYDRASKVKIKKKPRVNVAKYIIMTITALLIGYGVYLFNGWYINYSLENAVRVQTGEKVTIENKDEMLLVRGQVSSIERVEEIDKLIKRRTKLPVENHLFVPMRHIDERIKAESNSDQQDKKRIDEQFELLERNLEYRLKELSQKNVHLQKELDESKVYLEGLIQSKTDELSHLKKEQTLLKKVMSVKEELSKRLETVFKDSQYYQVEEQALDFAGLDLFTPGRVVYVQDAIVILGKEFEKYVKVLTAYKPYLDSIIIEGHSDSSGLEEDNIELSKKRALSVKYFVERLSIVKQYHMQPFIETKGYGCSQMILTEEGKEDANRSRRIKVRFELSDEKILKKLWSVLND
jgi:outer membrane protein OmpA-like peptidoglycan-associated protein